MPASSGAFRRPWEHSQHPYIFLNEDGNSFTFLGFNINAHNRLVGADGEELDDEDIPGVPDLAAKYGVGGRRGGRHDNDLSIVLKLRCGNLE